MSVFHSRLRRVIEDYEADRQPLFGSIGAARLHCLKQIIESPVLQADEELAKLTVFSFFYADPHRMSGTYLLHQLREELMRSMKIRNVLLDPLNLGVPPGTFESYSDRALKERFSQFSPEQKHDAMTLCTMVLDEQHKVSRHYKSNAVFLWVLNFFYNVFKIDFLKGQGITLSPDTKSDLDTYTKVKQSEHRAEHSERLHALSLFQDVVGSDESMPPSPAALV